MQSAILFPHYSLSNDNIVRHLFLYSSSFARTMSTDRPPQDSDNVKRLIQEMEEAGVVQFLNPEAVIDAVTQRFLIILKRAYEKGEELYTDSMGNYEKERASTKILPICPMDLWREVVGKLVDMDLAEISSSDAAELIQDQQENQGEWCLTTRQVMLAFFTSLVLEHQKVMKRPRVTDAPQYDDLATLIESVPNCDGIDRTVNRAVIEFPYLVANQLLNLRIDELKELREALSSYTESLMLKIRSATHELNRSYTMVEVTEALKKVNGQIQEDLKAIRQILQARKMEPVQRYAQYRWYPPMKSKLADASLPKSLYSAEVGFQMLSLPVARSEMEVIYTYPGCYVFALESPSFGQGVGILGVIKRFFS